MRLPANAERGAEFLDALEPGWEQRLDLNRLDLGDGCNCVLGQLHGDYGDAKPRLGLSERDAVRLGFNARGGQRFRDLTAAWAALALARLRA